MYYLLVLALLALFPLGFLVDAKTLVLLYIGLLFFCICSSARLFGFHFMRRIIVLTVLIRIGLYLYTVFHSGFSWESDLPFVHADYGHFGPLVQWTIDQMENGGLPSFSDLQRHGVSGKNGTTFSYILGLFLYVLGTKDVFDGIRFIPIFNFVTFVLLLLILYALIRGMGAGDSVTRIAITLTAFSPSMLYWNFVFMKDSFLSLLLVAFSYCLLKCIRVRNGAFLWGAIAAALSFLLYWDRPYFGAGCFIALSIGCIRKVGHNSMIKGLSHPAIFGVLVIAGVGGGAWVLEMFQYAGHYMFVRRFISQSSMLAGINNPVAGLVQLLLTPLPLHGTIKNTLCEVFNYSFVFQFVVVVLSVFGFRAMWRLRSDLLVLFLPMVVFLALYSFVAPGYNRPRDCFVPFLSILAAWGVVSARRFFFNSHRCRSDVKGGMCTISSVS